MATRRLRYELWQYQSGPKKGLWAVQYGGASLAADGRIERTGLPPRVFEDREQARQWAIEMGWLTPQEIG